MTVLSTTRRNDYTGNGATATYVFSFRIFAATDLLVTKKDTAGVQTTLVYPTDYSVLGVGLYSGGSITLTAGVLTTNHKITIRRLVPITQGSDIRNQGGYYPDVVENALDRLNMIALQHQDEIDRSVKLPETETGTPTLPTLENRINRFMAFDASGNIIAAAGTSANLGPVSGFINTLLDDADAATARATLGVAPISTFMATVLDDTTAAAARTTLGVLSKVTEASAENSGAVVVPDTGAVICTVNLGTVALTDTIMVTATTYSSRASDGTTEFFLQKSSGTAVIQAFNSRAYIRHLAYEVAAHTRERVITGMFKVTTAGTLVLELKGYSGVASITIAIGNGQLHAIVLRNG